MSDQRTFARVPYDTKNKVMRRERFLQEMDRVIPWGTLVAIIQPHYVQALARGEAVSAVNRPGFGGGSQRCEIGDHEQRQRGRSDAE